MKGVTLIFPLCLKILNGNPNWKVLTNECLRKIFPTASDFVPNDLGPLKLYFYLNREVRKKIKTKTYLCPLHLEITMTLSMWTLQLINLLVNDASDGRYNEVFQPDIVNGRCKLFLYLYIRELKLAPDKISNISETHGDIFLQYRTWSSQYS